MGYIKLTRSWQRGKLGQDVLPTERKMRAVGQHIIAKIVQRTQGGRSETGAPFKGYAASTGKPNPVTLTETGKMLDSLRIVGLTARSVQIGIVNYSRQRVARLHMAGTRKMPARRWLGIAKSWRSE